MPSVILPFTSGGYPLVSGNPWSGHVNPQGGIQLRISPTCSGTVYVGLSGNLTITSGALGVPGYRDGMPMVAGDSYFIPKSACGNSGQLGVYLIPDASCSGQARVFFEVY